MVKQYWLMKSEPDTYSIDKLANAKNQITSWEGVRNYQARNFMQSMKRGDLAFFYHSSCKIPAIVGVVEIVKEAHPDVSALDPNSPYYDPKSTKATPRWFMVQVKLQEKFKYPITLTTLRNNPDLASFVLLNKGNRLSVMPVLQEQWDAILKRKHHDESR